jgi:preprotein translocase subunit SecG
LLTILLIVHLFVTLALIGVVLIQRSEGGGLGIGTSQGMGSFMSGRGTANLLTRATAVLATVFMALSLTLALLNHGTSGVGGSILDTGPLQAGAPPPSAPNGAPSGTPSGTPSPAPGGTPAGSGPAAPLQAPAPAPEQPPGPSVPTN